MSLNQYHCEFHFGEKKKHDQAFEEEWRRCRLSLIKWIMLLCSCPLILSQCLPPSFSCSLWDSFVHSPCVRWARTPRFSWSASQSSCPTCLRLDSIPVSSCISDRYSAHLYIDDTKTHNWNSFLFSGMVDLWGSYYCMTILWQLCKHSNLVVS